MLNPVGIVDTGRISVDTGHKFEASREAAPGIAARYYMNRNFYIADPDAFTVSRQTLGEQAWHGGKHPLSLDEAKVSIPWLRSPAECTKLATICPRLAPIPTAWLWSRMRIS